MVKVAPVLAFRGVYDPPTLAPIPDRRRKIQDLDSSGEARTIDVTLVKIGNLMEALVMQDGDYSANLDGITLVSQFWKK